MNKPLHGLFAIVTFAMFGVVSSAFGGWTATNFDPANYSRPDAALSGTVVDGEKSQFDGDITTYGGVDTWYSRRISFSSPKDITEIRIYPIGTDATAYTLPNVFAIDVIYSGEDSWTSLSGTGYSFDSSKSWTNCIQMIFTPDSGQYVAKRVTAIGIHHIGIGGNCKQVAEYEFLGADSFIPALSAVYEPGDGTLTATLTATAKYPAQVWFCSGETDGGSTSTNNWDKVIPAFVAGSADQVVDQRTVDFKYCRYCFEDADDGFVWSDGFIWTDEPAGIAEMSSCGATLLKFAVNVTWCGGTNKAADVYAAIVEHGGTMSPPELKATGIAWKASAEVVINGLSPLTEYDWLVRLRNVDGYCYDITGTVTTVTSAAMWFKDPYEYMTWTVPPNWLSGFKGKDTLCDGVVTHDLSKDSWRTGISNQTNSWEFSSPKDLETLEILMDNCALEVTGVEIMYSGSEEWTGLASAALSYSDSVPSGTLRRGIFKLADGGYFVENVTAIRVITGACDPGHVGACEMLVTGRDHAQVCRWEVGRYTAAAYVPAPDALDGMLVRDVDGSGCKKSELKTLFTNGDITDSAFSIDTYYNGGDIYWEFASPVKIRQLRFATSTQNDYPDIGCDGVWVKYDGDADYTFLEGSEFTAFKWSNSSGETPFLKLTSETNAWLASGVTAVRAKPKVYYWRVSISEIEIAGELMESKKAGLILFLR